MTSAAGPAAAPGTAAVAPPAAKPAPTAPPVAVAARMIAVAMVAAVSATIMSQANGLAAAELGGLLSVSADEASWIGTATSMAEIAVVPLAALLTASLTPRRLALLACIVYAAGAAASLTATDLSAFIAARLVVGAAGGVMPVMMMVMVMATLPPGPRRRVGLAVFAFASSIPVALAPSIGGALIDTFGPRGLAIAEMAWVGLFLPLAAGLLPRLPLRADLLARADWRSYVPLAVGLAAVVLVLSQGERRFWFENPMIVAGSAVAVAALCVAMLSLTTRDGPLIQLSLLTRPTFGWAFVLAVVFRFGLLVSGFVMPQVLTRLQGFRLPEIGEATLWVGLAHVIFFPIAWWTSARFDTRLSLAGGLLLFAASALMAMSMTLDWQVAQFVPSLIVLGAGQAFFLVATLSFATAGVAPEQGPTAATLFNVARVLGQAAGTAMIGTLVTEREKFHSARIVERLVDATPWFAERLSAVTSVFQPLHGDAALAQAQAQRIVTQAASNQAFVLAYADAFLVIALILVAASFLVAMLPALPGDRPPPIQGTPS